MYGTIHDRANRGASSSSALGIIGKGRTVRPERHRARTPRFAFSRLGNCTPERRPSSTDPGGVGGRLGHREPRGNGAVTVGSELGVP
jgi:hypothetical protein